MRRIRNTSLGLIVGVLLSLPSRAAVPVGRVTEIACAPTRLGTLAIRIENTVWITTDEGTTWTPQQRLHSPSDSDSVRHITGAGDPANDDPPFDVGETIDPNQTDRIHWSPIQREGTAPHDDAVPEPVALTVHLAVGDRGEFAVSMGSRLFVGDGAGVREWIPSGLQNSDVKGMAFDSNGRLWVAFTDALIRISSASEYFTQQRRWRIQGAARPTLDKRRGRILVPTTQGLLAFPTDGTKPEVFRLGNVDAAVEMDGEWLIVSKGRIRIVDEEQNEKRELPTPPGAVQKIISDSRHRVFLHTSGGDWFGLEGGRWQHLNITALDVDSRGDVWVGTRLGPKRMESAASVSPLDAGQVAAIHLRAIEKLSQSPGPPPGCRNSTIRPLPQVGLLFGYHQGADRKFASEWDWLRSPHLTGARNRNELFAGVSLVWTFDPPDLSKCYARRHIFAEMKSDRARKIDAVLKQSGQSVRGKSADVVQAIEQITHRMRDEQMLVVLTNPRPDEETLE